MGCGILLKCSEGFSGKTGYRNRGQRYWGGMDDLHCPPGWDGGADNEQKQRQKRTELELEIKQSQRCL